MLSLKNILSRLELGIQHFLACVSGHLYLRVLVPADPVCLRTLGDLLSEGTRACGHQCLQALRIYGYPLPLITMSCHLTFRNLLT